MKSPVSPGASPILSHTFRGKWSGDLLTSGEMDEDETSPSSDSWWWLRRLTVWSSVVKEGDFRRRDDDVAFAGVFSGVFDVVWLLMLSLLLSLSSLIRVTLLLLLLTREGSKCLEVSLVRKEVVIVTPVSLLFCGNLTSCCSLLCPDTPTISSEGLTCLPSFGEKMRKKRNTKRKSELLKRCKNWFE